MRNTAYDTDDFDDFEGDRAETEQPEPLTTEEYAVRQARADAEWLKVHGGNDPLF